MSLASLSRTGLSVEGHSRKGVERERGSSVMVGHKMSGTDVLLSEGDFYLEENWCLRTSFPPLLPEDCGTVLWLQKQPEVGK